jgi:hypothetical protein
MPPKQRRRAGGRKQKRQLDEDVSDNLEQDDDLLNMEANNIPGFEQEDLTEEQKNELIFKELNSKNPQAACNIMQYSFKQRQFIKMEETNHIVYHHNVDGDQLLIYHPISEKDQAKGVQPNMTDEYREQEDYLEQKKKFDK